MTSLFQSIFSFFLTWWGAFLIAALDASMLFFLPFGVDAVVIYMSARDEEWFWLYPLVATAGWLSAWMASTLGLTHLRFST